MKNTLARLHFLVTKIDRQYIQLAYFVFMLAGFVLLQVPVDGGGGPH